MTIPAAIAPAFPVDSSLPMLEIAADAAAMKDVFAGIFAGGPAACAVDDCRISRIRYRQHTRCLIQYALRLRNRTTGASSEQWVSATMYAEQGRAERLSRESASRVDLDTSRPPIAPAAFIPHLQMAIDVFPHDRKLPHAALLLERRDSALNAAILEAFGGGAWTITGWLAAPVRYREHLALVVRYTVDATDTDTGATARRTFFLKTYPDADQPARVYAHLCSLAHYAATASIGVHVESPLAYLGHLNAVLLERTAGHPLDALLASGDDATIHSAVRQTARALAMFNQSDAPVSRTYTVGDHLSAIRRAERVLRCARPDLGSLLGDVTRVAAARMVDVALAPTHRDMKPEHVLLMSARVAFIDLDSCAAADPVLDPALMLARFTALAGVAGDAPRLERARATFAREYFEHVPGDWRRRLRPYYAGALVEVAAGIFHRQEPAWSDRVFALVKAAHAALVAPAARLLHPFGST